MVISLPKNGFDISEKVNKNQTFDFCSCISIGFNNVPEKNSDFLTVIGGGDCVKEDIKKWGLHGDIVTANFAGLFLEKNYDHLVSFHSDVFKYIINLRKLAINLKKPVIHTSGNVNRRIRDNIEFINYLWVFEPKPRSSGLLALWIGLALGYKKILMLGIPLNKTGRFTDMEDHPCRNLYYDETITICKKKINLLKFSGVRSASGKTAEIFGEPTWPWIQEKLN